MLTLLFIILLFSVFGKLLGFALRATWGMTRIIFSIIFLPLTLVGMVFIGLIHIAFPLLVVIGIVVLVQSLGDTM